LKIGRWHYGKLALLWAWVAILTLVLLGLLQRISSSPGGATLGFLLIALIVAMPIGMSVITWKWLSAKEGS